MPTKKGLRSQISPGLIYGILRYVHHVYAYEKVQVYSLTQNLSNLNLSVVSLSIRNFNFMSRKYDTYLCFFYSVEAKPKKVFLYKRTLSFIFQQKTDFPAEIITLSGKKNPA